MSPTLNEVRDAALSLSLGERVILADALHESMAADSDPDQMPFESAAAFHAELDRRLDRYLSGEDPGHDWEDVKKEADAILREP